MHVVVERLFLYNEYVSEHCFVKSKLSFFFFSYVSMLLISQPHRITRSLARTLFSRSSLPFFSFDSKPEIYNEQKLFP